MSGDTEDKQETADNGKKDGDNKAEPELEHLHPDPTPKPNETSQPVSGMATSSQSKKTNGEGSQRMATREWTSLPGERTMLQTEWTMAPGETPSSPAISRTPLDGSSYDIQHYDEDNKLPDKEYFRRLNSGGLRILRELKDWQQKYIGDKINLDEETESLLKSGIEWRPMAESLDEASRLEVEEELARIAPLTLPELIEIVSDPST